MREEIFKLQPNRTIQLRGFDSLGASAAMHSATSNSFRVSGMFRDPADFAVLILYDADNFYEHPRLKYLPDFNFDGLTLTFDVRYRGLMPLDSVKYPTIDWPYLDIIREDGATGRIPLIQYAIPVQGEPRPAEAEFEIVFDNAIEDDRLTLWYLNFAFDYFAPDYLELVIEYEPDKGSGTVHSVRVDGAHFTYTQEPEDTGATIAAKMAVLLADADGINVTAGAHGFLNCISIRSNLPVEETVLIEYASWGLFEELEPPTAHTLGAVDGQTVAEEFARQINGVDWQTVDLPIYAEAIGQRLRLWTKPGIDGNMLRMYAVWKNDRLKTSQREAVFAGGESNVTWRVTLDFSTVQALGPDGFSLQEVKRIRQMWLTFAPFLSYGKEYEPEEWEAEFTNWTVTGPDAVRRLQVAGPGSVRVEETSSWCQYSGVWKQELGFFSHAYARLASHAGDSVTVSYSCPVEHDLYLGTSLYVDRGIAGIRIDGGPETQIDCYLNSEPPVNTRRLIQKAAPAGSHRVEIVVKDGKNPAAIRPEPYFYFDFLEAAVSSDLPAAMPAQPRVSPALDYSTDHTYKLPPSRILWNFDQMGFTGPVNEYLGVFWWNQRSRAGAVIPEASILFDGNYEPGDQIFITIGARIPVDGESQMVGQPYGKSVFPNEDGVRIARHFALFINSHSVGVWAETEEDRLILHARSAAAAYSFDLEAYKEDASKNRTWIAPSGSLRNGDPGVWQIDPGQQPALNSGARAWHDDFYRECVARSREVTTACSMELVNPPPGFAAVHPDGAEVITSVGFGGLHSTHCAFKPVMAEYQKRVYSELAALMHHAGTVPNIQFGEYLWWFFDNTMLLDDKDERVVPNPEGGMAFYDAETRADAFALLGRELHVFRTPNDDPDVNDGSDALFLRNRLRDYVLDLMAHIRGQFPQTKFEVLLPFDVNYPEPTPVYNLGGKLNRFVNIPVEWQSKETAGFDRVKMEALNFGAYLRNLDMAHETILLPLRFGWPKSSVRYLVPVFRGGTAWDREFRFAMGLGLPVVNMWAFDHVCLYGWPLRQPGRGRAMQIDD